MKNCHKDFESRRTFLGDVGRGMIAASVGATVANDLGFSTAFAEKIDQGKELKFGEMEPLVELMRDTAPDQLQELLVAKLKSGDVSLKQLISAGALANARTFGGEDYQGFHCMFAMAPALEMSREMPSNERALPVLKVLYRNTARMQKVWSKKPESKLRAIDAADVPADTKVGELLRRAVRAKDAHEGDRILGGLTDRSIKEAFNALQWAVQDKTNVHGVALAHRAWEMVDIIGEEHAHTMLRQSVHFCALSNPGFTVGDTDHALQKVLAHRLDRLSGKKLGTTRTDDAWIIEMSRTIYESSRVQAAEAVADALAEGISPEVIGEATSLAANELVLRQLNERTHGDSRGVHASDAVNAWRNIARVTNDRNRFASLIVAAYHVAGAGHQVITGPWRAGMSDAEDPFALFREQSTETDPQKLLAEADEAIRGNDQIQAAAAVFRYSQLEQAESRPVFDLMLKYAVSEDGRLHAEKYYRTVTEEFASIRPAFHWRQLVALARVTASTYGMTQKDQSGGRAPGYLEARRLLNLS